MSLESRLALLVASTFCEANLDPEGVPSFLKPLEDAFPLGSLARLVRNNVCGTPLDAPLSTGGPVIPGGQCPGTLYRVVVEYTGYSNPIACAGPVRVDLTLNNRVGPITGVSVEETPGAPEGNYRIILSDGSGDGIVLTPSCDPQEVFIKSTSPQSGPDDCGNGGGLPDYVPTQRTGDFDNGDGTTSPADVTVFSPQLGPFNTIFAPVVVNVGGVTIEGNFELFPGSRFDINLGGNPEPGSPVEPGPGDLPMNPPELDNRAIIAVIVESTIVSPEVLQATFVEQDSGTDLYLPRLANLSFWIDQGLFRGWSRTIPIQKRFEYVPVPGALPASSWSVTPETGVEVRVEPIYGPWCPCE